MKTNHRGPQFVQYFGPILDSLRKLGGSGTPDEVAEDIAQRLKVPEKVKNGILASGQSRFYNQVAWARFYLSRDGYLESSKRGVWSLTDKGRDTRLDSNGAQAVFKRLSRKFSADRREKGDPATEQTDTLAAPESPFRGELLDLLLKLPAEGFERLCQRLLREAGFVEVAVTGRTGDGGIDGHGTLQVNPLVSFRVLFQCKRYKGSVVPKQVRDFRGAMQGRSEKGIIITTGTFTGEAKREAARDGVPPIELVDGDRLIDMFEKLELGLKPITTFAIDQNFFAEFQK